MVRGAAITDLCATDADFARLRVGPELPSFTMLGIRAYGLLSRRASAECYGW